jgi:hypothetical protein
MRREVKRSVKIDYVEEPLRQVRIWLTRAEGKDQALLDSLKPRYKEWKAQGYLPVVFESGESKLEDDMYMLLKHNYELIKQQRPNERKASR